MVKVSVLMPIYQTPEEYLRSAIESILNQTYTDFEFLILDDCPQNSRESIVHSYQDKRIKYFKNEKNLGITPSRNKLIDMAKGEYLAVMDHDDISLSSRFEKEVSYLDCHKEVGVVGSNYEKFPFYKLKNRPETNEEIENVLMKKCAVLHPSSMIRKSVLKNLRYEEKFSPAEDYALWCRLIGQTEFYNIQEVLFKYRDHGSNTSKIQQEKMKKATKSIHEFVRAEHPDIYKRSMPFSYLRYKIFHYKEN